jgi:type IV secretory pathway ATPase VirB11/archaellum biosynthesis ATPase
VNVKYIPPSERKALDIKEYHRESSDVQVKVSDFKTVCENAKEYVYSVYDRKVEEKANGETKEDYVNIYHNAMKGIPAAVSHLKKMIEDFVVENGLRSTKYPIHYKNLNDAIFEEEFGWGPLSAFRYEKDSEGAQVLGIDVKFKRSWGWELQPFKFRNIEQVTELSNRFANMHKSTSLNQHTTPEMETRTHDNIRVSIMIPDRMHEEPVITLRRKVVRDLNFRSMSEYGTIPTESIPIFESLARFTVNSVIAGPPGCGKSTMLQAFLEYALYEYKNGKKIPERINTVYAETFPEWDVRTIHPSSNVLHLIGRGEEFEQVISSAILRHDISRVVLGEIREHEVGLYRRASLQGIKQVMGTLHDLDPLAIPEILTNLYLQYYSSSADHSSVLQTFTRNLHFAVSMDEFLFEDEGNDSEKLVKKVTGVHVYDVDSLTKETQMYTIMEYNMLEDKWIYKSDIPEKFERLISKYNRKAYLKFKTTLDRLSKETSVLLKG